MTTTTAPRRRPSDMSGVKAAELKGRMDVIEEKIDNVENRVGEMSGQMKELTATVHGIRDSVIAQEAERKAFLEAFKMIGEAQRQPAPQTDEIVVWKRRVFNLLQIAGAVLVLLLILQKGGTLLNPETTKEAREIAHAAAP